MLRDAIAADRGEKVGGKAMQVLATRNLRDRSVLLVLDLRREAGKTRPEGAGKLGAGDALGRHLQQPLQRHGRLAIERLRVGLVALAHADRVDDDEAVLA